MKKILISALVAFSMSAAVPVAAKNHDKVSFNNHTFSNYSGGNYSDSKHASTRHVSHVRHGGNRHSNNHHRGRHHSRHGHGHKHHSKAGYILGGLAIGAIISNAHHHSHHNTHHGQHNHHRRTVYQPVYHGTHSAPVIIHQSAPVQTSPVIIRQGPTSTYRRVNGIGGSECYLVNTNRDGNEILTQVPQLNCEG